ncbi:TerB family tellurite resistance protein [Parapedobacter sp. ISTM3]|uniref:TerB family tellurite resistance protein n=1 Tax=Parapedobacter sp. ISTM3 TaxID=2800130 RepID=UPI00190580D0|nr:TerB family tellurite resistance protein [Parapedobacter sp. ISTM3]MBK1439797.1 TerB family tellurite resistance protein [Parapedobacter sp. ISTM3]
MKRTITRILIGLGICCTLQLHLVSAQSAEITQLLLNVEKLSQLRQILSDMKRGYDIVFRGYNTIKDISQGNFSLHKVFLDGLMEVNPELTRYRRVADIIRNQGAILTEYRSAYRRFVQGGRFTQQEIRYMAGVYGNLFDSSLRNLDELAMILTASSLRMSDAERLRAIDRLHESMEGKLVSLREFNRHASGLDAARERAWQEMETLKNMYGHR